MSGVVADAFADEAGSRYGREAGLRQRFLELLQPLLAEVRQVAGEQALLAETVSVFFADSGSSLTERGGIATAEEVDIDTLRARMARACREVQATVYVPELVAASAEVRQHLRLRGELDNAGRKTAAVWASCLPHTYRGIVFR
ncbi:hypothetical protein ACGFY9_28260 [Streptomyces sp. NPDC048504]|uniref:hypothetical protein n=1 Tax=Streptomyces sp. NPDC048504 TaxID=3365559 RepID=UPI003714B8B7